MNNGVILDNLVRVRNSTGLSQEKFYAKYLEELEISNVKAESSKQGFMRELENGKKPITPEILIRYAQIAKCSVDDLLGLTKKDLINSVSEQYVTFSDCANDLFRLYENEDCKIDRMNTKSSPETYYISFSNKRINELLKQICSIETLNNKTIFKQWKSGVLKDSAKYKKEEDYRDLNEELPELLSRVANNMIKQK